VVLEGGLKGLIKIYFMLLTFIKEYAIIIYVMEKKKLKKVRFPSRQARARPGHPGRAIFLYKIFIMGV
jgi:hypothetical protein